MRLADIIPSILNGKTFVRKVDGELRVVYYRRRYACVASFVILYVRSTTTDWLLWVFIISGFVALGGGLGLAAVSFDLHFMYGQIEDLKIAYESVYGSLPEGIL